MFRRNISPPISGSKNKPSKISAWKLGLFCDPEVEGDMFPWNFGWLHGTISQRTVLFIKRLAVLRCLLKFFFRNLKYSGNIFFAEWLWCRKRIFDKLSKRKFIIMAVQKEVQTVQTPFIGIFTSFRKWFYDSLLLLPAGIPMVVNTFLYASPKYFRFISNRHSIISFICLRNIGFLLIVNLYVREVRRNLASRAIKYRNCMAMYCFSGEEHATQSNSKQNVLNFLLNYWIHL
jgi:hypothetical protein